MRSVFVKRVSRATSKQDCLYGVVNHTIYKQEYRSGHNEAVLKTVCPKGTGVRIPLPAPIKMVYSLRVDLFLLPQSEGTNPKGSHTAGTEHTTRNRAFAVSASRGDVGLNLYRSGTISINLTPSSIPLFRFERILTPLCDSLSRGMGFAFERKPSGSLLTSGGAKNLRQRRIPLFQA